MFFAEVVLQFEFLGVASSGSTPVGLSVVYIYIYTHMCVWVFGQQYVFWVFGYLLKKQVRHPLAAEIEWIFDLPASPWVDPKTTNFRLELGQKSEKLRGDSNEKHHF